MKKSQTIVAPRHLISLLVISFGLLLILLVLLVHVQALSSRIAELESRESTLSTEVASYKRSLCSNSDTKQVSVLTKHTMQSGGYDRSYQVHTPANYDPTVRYPVILSFDGIEGSGDRMEGYSGLDALPALVVYPDAMPGKLGFTSWQGAPYSLDGTQDMQFVNDILDTLPSQYCVDNTRTFAVGMSNGGAFATIVGCELGNRINAVASVSGAYYTTCKQEQRTPSLLVAHSTADRQAPFNGSSIRRLPQVPQYVEQQAAERHCKMPVTTDTTELASYYNWIDCDDGSSLQFVVLKAQAHGWLMLPEPEVKRAPSSAGYIWKFFEEAAFRN